jgi:hypothetical protein
LKNDTWYYRHILTKWAFLKRFGCLEGPESKR